MFDVAEKMEDRHEAYKDFIRKLTLMDDIFMRNVLKKKECTEYVLQVIMGKDDLRLVDQVIQMDYKNLQGRSLIMDCLARDENGQQYDIEIQQENSGASPKRARYHASLMDMNVLDPGDEFERLPETYVIFITRNDVIGSGRPVYHVERRIDETSEQFRDGSHILYVDASQQNDTELGCLMHDMNCKNASEMKSRILSDRVRELKETQEGVEHMCKEMEAFYHKVMKWGLEQGIEEGIEQGRAQGLEQGIMEGEMRKSMETAQMLARRGMQAVEIAEILKTDAAKVKEWIAEK